MTFKSLGLLALALATHSFAAAQINLTPFSPALFADGSLFHGVVAGSQPEAITITLSLDGRPIATQQGTIGAGTTALEQAQTTGAVFEGSYGHLLRFGLLPEGNYQVCYKTSGGVSGCQTYNHRVKPFAGCISLVSPANRSEQNSTWPLLAWSSAAAGIAGIESQLLVTEQRTSEPRPSEHFAAPALLNQRVSATTALAYPASATPLENGKSYTWHCEMLYAGKVVCRSEVWSFNIANPLQAKRLPISLSYIDLTKVGEMSSFFILGELKLFLPGAEPSTVTINIFDEDGDEVKTKISPVEFAKNKEYATINLHQQASLGHLKTYTVQMTTPQAVRRIALTYVSPDFYSLSAD